MNFDLNNLVRENIKKLIPYSSARDEFKGEANVFLDSNENSLGSPLTKWYNRYPDPLQIKVKEKLSSIKTVPVNNTFLSNGSDESIVVIDEAYINFSRVKSFFVSLDEYPNLVVMQTFSKAWGLAALRLGIAFASEEIIHVMNKIKPPYNVNQATQELALKAMEEVEQV